MTVLRCGYYLSTSYILSDLLIPFSEMSVHVSCLAGRSGFCHRMWGNAAVLSPLGLHGKLFEATVMIIAYLSVACSL